MRRAANCCGALVLVWLHAQNFAPDGGSSWHGSVSQMSAFEEVETKRGVMCVVQVRATHRKRPRCISNPDSSRSAQPRVSVIRICKIGGWMKRTPQVFSELMFSRCISRFFCPSWNATLPL